MLRQHGWHHHAALGTGDSVRGDESWRSQAACSGDDAAVFFPPSHLERKEERDRRERAARQVCGGCDVRQRCLEYALHVAERHGIWGGLNETQRSRLRRTRLRAANRLPT